MKKGIAKNKIIDLKALDKAKSATLHNATVLPGPREEGTEQQAR